MRPLRAVLLVAFTACATPAAGPRAPAPPVLALTHATVIDATGGAPLPDHTVLVSGDRIVSVGPSASVAVPRGARVVDARGRYVIPGLWDMHVHLSAAGAAELPRFVAHGITGVRDMGGTWEIIRGWRERIESGALVGPRVKTAGPIIENARWLQGVSSIPEGRAYLAEHPRLGVSTADEARAAVDSLARLGVDFIKIRNAPPRDAYFALVQAARGRGLRVAGHLPRGGLGFGGAMEAGQADVEHIDVLADELDDLSQADRRALFGQLRERGTWLGPTLVAEMSRVYPSAMLGAIVEDSLGLLDARRRDLSPTLLAFWRLSQSFDQYETPRDWNPVIARELGYLREMRDAGVRMLAGTDFGARLVYPGSSLHDELALLVRHAGLSPMQALQAATRNAAAFFGAEEEFGTVQAGRRADLVVLDGDPLADIRNVGRIHAVVLRGELYPRARLDELLAPGGAVAGRAGTR